MAWGNVGTSWRHELLIEIKVPTSGCAGQAFSSTIMSAAMFAHPPSAAGLVLLSGGMRGHLPDTAKTCAGVPAKGLSAQRRLVCLKGRVRNRSLPALGERVPVGNATKQFRFRKSSFDISANDYRADQHLLSAKRSPFSLSGVCAPASACRSSASPARCET